MIGLLINKKHIILLIRYIITLNNIYDCKIISVLCVWLFFNKDFGQKIFENAFKWLCYGHNQILLNLQYLNFSKHQLY